jgi:hypothetical protein
MTDLPGRLRVMARLTGRDDDADTAAEAAREIERLRLTDAEREAISFFAEIHADDEPPHEYAVVLGKLLERLA